jgi:ribokinase
MPTPARIAVLGSINMDLVVRCALLPKPGETIIADSASEIPGGKGANQAVASARAGGQVTMIGRIGDDAFASRLRDNLSREKICVDFVSETKGCASGIAIVAVESSGENAIMVVPGANGRVTTEDVDAAANVIRSADVLLLQLEIPLESVIAAASIALEAGVRVILDPAPMPLSLPDQVLNVDVICPNQSEAAAIAGRPIETAEDAHDCIPRLHERGAKNVIITLGGQGAIVSDGASLEWIAPFAITPVDTTAAGDAFAGALAVRLAEGAQLSEAARFAAAAGAIAATRLGAQPGMPTRSEIEQLVRQTPH